MFSKPSRSCTFSCRIKYVTCLLLYSLAHPLGYSVPRWPAVCAGTVSSAGLRLPHSSFPTCLFQILSSINCWTATRLSWALGSQAPFCSWEGSTDRSPSCILHDPKGLDHSKLWTGLSSDPGFPLHVFDYVHYAVSHVSYYLLLYAHPTFLNCLITLSRH